MQTLTVDERLMIKDGLEALMAAVPQGRVVQAPICELKHKIMSCDEIIITELGD